ncbi:MAG: PASTA domain-containing protein [Bacteroidales bacterium]
MNLLRFLLSKDFLKHLVLAVVGLIILTSTTFIVLDVYTHHGQSIPVPNFEKLTIDEAKQIAKKHNLHLEVTDSIFQDDWPKGTVAKQNPEAGFHVKKGRTIFLIMNATEPELIQMPNVVGVSHRQAKAILRNSGLKIGKLDHVPDIAVNNVLKQKLDGEEIEPGEKIPKNEEITLVLGKGLSNKKSNLPDLRGLEFKQAENKIHELALNTGVVKYDESVENEEDSSSAVVWKQYPPYKKSQQIRLGSYIDLWLTVDSTKLPNQDSTLIKNMLHESDSL